MHDITIVGARCAGAMTARLLAKKGYRVLMVDRTEISQSYPQSNIIWLPGSRRLSQWGLFDDVVRSGAPVVREITTDYGDLPLTQAPSPFEGQREMVGPRRKFLDPLFLQSAREAGAEFWEGFQVESLVWDRERVVGVRGKNYLGQARELKASWVIGADGRNSLVAKQARATVYHELPTQTFSYFSYFSGMPEGLVGMGLQDGRTVFVFPTHERLSMVGVFWRIEKFREVREDIGRHYYESFQKYSWLRDYVLPQHQEEGFYGHADSPNFIRQAHGPGWALVGDAACHRDPITGHGLSDAFRDVDLLTEALDEVLSGKKDEGEALGAYDRERRRLGEEIYEFTLRSTRLDPSERLLSLRQALRHQPEPCTQFHGIFAGSYSPKQFFSQDNVQSIVETFSA